jgi:aspartate racemase
MLLGRMQERGRPGRHLLIYSIDLARLLELAGREDQSELIEYLLEAVDRLARGGAGLALFAANTPHLVFDDVARRAPIPLVSMVTAACDAAQALGLRRLGLLGTRFTMAGGFYPKVFAQQSLEVVVPDAQDQIYVHERYVTELVAGRFLESTRAGMVAVMDRMRADHGIDGVILGGTELPLLLRDLIYPVPLLDTTQIHVDAVVAAAGS